MTAQPPNPLTSGALCAQAGITRGMLRVYEREGLLDAPPRTPAGYRLYAADALQRLQAIRQLKEVGFTLREIALLLSERASTGFSPAQLRRLAREQLASIDQRIARLQVVREYAAAVAAGDTGVLDDPGCGFLLQFLAAGQMNPPAPAQPAAPLARNRRARTAIES